MIIKIPFSLPNIHSFILFFKISLKKCFAKRRQLALCVTIRTPSEYWRVFCTLHESILMKARTKLLLFV